MLEVERHIHHHLHRAEPPINPSTFTIEKLFLTKDFTDLQLQTPITLLCYLLLNSPIVKNRD
ncbi:unnamed protein product [Arabidopsis thaliana]|uniref:Uncharacterized protein n=1 Tax=Arabidopsis thaliana TaxID=3702 RepID=A0A5S9WY38_ARATH|nr:unnamed protein product [Arabidopsis thaliana]